MKQLMKFQNIAALFLSIAVLLQVLGCAALTGTERNRDAAEFTYSDDLQEKRHDAWPDNALRKAFEDYWTLRFGGEVQTIFEMEAPYVQYMVEPEKYKWYVKGAKLNDLQEIKISNFEKHTDYYYTVHFTSRFVMENGEEKEVYRKDEWVKAGGEWYHVLRDFLMFQNIS